LKSFSPEIQNVWLKVPNFQKIYEQAGSKFVVVCRKTATFCSKRLIHDAADIIADFTSL